MNGSIVCVIIMEVAVFVVLTLFLAEITGSTNATFPLNVQDSRVKIEGLLMEPRRKIPFNFVAAIVSRRTSKIVATAAVISPHWVLTSAHLLPNDEKGVAAEEYFILAGRPLQQYQPVYVLTHPSYTWGLYTAEDLALLYVRECILTRPVFVSSGRFPWNYVMCDFIHWQDVKFSEITLNSLHFFKHEITVVHNCLASHKKSPPGLMKYYLNDILCGLFNTQTECAGKTGGILYCENLLVGFLIRKTWCQTKTANFTDIGSYSNWLSSRVEDGQYIRLTFFNGESSFIQQMNFIFLCLTITVPLATA